jgi:hypothetical protein
MTSFWESYQKTLSYVKMILKATALPLTGLFHVAPSENWKENLEHKKIYSY